MIENTQYIWLAVFLIGLALLALAIFRKTSTIKVPQAPATIIGVLLMVLGFMWGVMPLYQDAAPITTTTTIVTPRPDTVIASFDMGLENGTTGKLAPATVTVAVDEGSAQILLYVEDTGADMNDFVNCLYTSLNFSFAPIPPSGANADDLATIYWETDYTMTYEGNDILHESSGDYYANWSYKTDAMTDTKTKLYSGQATMLMTQGGWAQIDYKFDEGNSSGYFSEELDTIGESGSWFVRFYNADRSWSKVYTISWIYLGDT